jgi:shikimate kinase
MNIFLIGYRCSGKTAVGRMLAHQNARLFVDTDDEVVKKSNMSIKDIVNNEGWDSFRQKERRIIQGVCGRDHQVVATGGGIVLDRENVADMKNTGKLVWLRADADTVKKRMLADQRTEDLRPSLTGRDLLEEIEEILGIRNPHYEAAMDFSIETDARSVDEVCAEIKKKYSIKQ